MNQITEILHRLADGQEDALAELTPLVYDQLRKMAQSQLADQDAKRWDATELVHEAYLRMIGDQPIAWRDRTHFFAVAATIIRRVLIDQARRTKALKRGGQKGQANLDLDKLGSRQSSVDLVELDEALNRLSQLSERQAKLVELRFFGGLSEQEAANFLGVSRRTISGDWAMARAWLIRELSN